MPGDESSTAGSGISRRRFVRDSVALAASAAVAGPATALARQVGAANTVFRNGRVITVAGNRLAQAVAVTGGRIAYVGSDSGVASFVGAGTEVIDLRGRTLMRASMTATCTRWPAGSR